MVTLADAGAHPRTMMIMYLNTGTTVTAVERAWRSPKIASTTLRNFNFFPIDYSYHFSTVVRGQVPGHPPRWLFLIFLFINFGCFLTDF